MWKPRSPRSAVTDASGFYQIQPLPIGTYSVSVEAAGFSKMSSAPSHLEINQTMRVDLKLEIGSVSDVVTVDSQSSIIETQNATHERHGHRRGHRRTCP